MSAAIWSFQRTVALRARIPTWSCKPRILRIQGPTTRLFGVEKDDGVEKRHGRLDLITKEHWRLVRPRAPATAIAPVKDKVQPAACQAACQEWGPPTAPLQTLVDTAPPALSLCPAQLPPACTHKTLSLGLREAFQHHHASQRLSPVAPAQGASTAVLGDD